MTKQEAITFARAVEQAMTDIEMLNAENARLTKLVIELRAEAVRLNTQAVPDTREMFNAGWCAAARFCDREDAVYDGLVGPGGCPAFEVAYRAALSAAQDAAGGVQWVDLTDDDRERAFRSMPDMLDGFLKKWGWLHFAKAIEAICREKNDNRAAQKGASNG